MKKKQHISKLKLFFQIFAEKISEIVGSPWAFLTAILVIVLWGSSGTFFNFGTTWHLLINSTTTIITFLMVFLIQNTQNRETKALHLKIDELLKRAGVHTNLMDIEDLSDEERNILKEKFKKIYLDSEKKKKKNH